MIKIIDAFLYFSQKIINGDEGVFFVLDRPEIKSESIWIMGFGQKESINFDDDVFPKFCTTDFLGKEQYTWKFKNVFSSFDKKFCKLNDKEKKKITFKLKNIEKIKLKKKLSFYASETKESFIEKVKNIQNFEQDGNAWVVNLTQNIFGKLNSGNNRKELLLGSYFNFLQTSTHHCGGLTLTYEQDFCSFSPEVFCIQEEKEILTYPIKGTGSKDFLETSEKEISELNMITDLLRNDFGRICSSVEVEKERILTAERDFYHAHAEIKGDLMKKFDWEQFTKLLPAGSISGAPKKKVIEKILELENFDRKFYTGTFGVQFSSKYSVFNILIRTLFLGQKHWYFPVGAGITVESNPVLEFEETFKKAKVFKRFCT